MRLVVFCAINDNQGIATTRIKKEKATTYIMFTNRLQIPVFNFKNNLRLNAIKNFSLIVIISHIRHPTHNYFLRIYLDNGVVRK